MSKNTGTSELINYFDLGVNGDVGISGNLTLDTIANAVVDTDKFLVSDNGIIKYRTGAELLSDIGAAGSFVTLATAQTITGQKTFTTEIIGTSASFTNSGSNRDLIVTHTSGSGVAVDISKFGDGEGLRVSKYSGSGNAVTITGGLLSAEAASFSGNIAANGGLTLAAAGTADSTILRNTSGTTSSTTGSNVIGFNGTNNIFVSTQNRGGFILGFNNSVQNREYTLPDASGTIALTSSIPANPIGGTGTTNYLPKFTGSTTIGNSLFTDNGINGAIGGENYSSGTGVRTFNITAGEYPGLVFWANNTTTGSIFSYTYTGNLFLSADPTNVFVDSKISFFIDNSERLAIFNDGNVTIANSPTNSGFKLYVVAPSAAIATFAGTTNGYIDITDGTVNSRLQNTAQGFLVGTVNNYNLNFRTSNTIRLTIDGSTGAATFTNSTSGNALRLYTSYASGRALNFGFSDGSVLPTAAFYIGNQTAVGVYIGDETTTKGLYVKANGNVGLGTTIPERQLVISNAGAEGIEFTAVGSQTYEVITYNRSTSAYTPLQFESSKYTFNRGNVLIGTTTDLGARLYVNGQVRADNFAIQRAGISRGGLYTFDAVAGLGTDYSVGIFSEGEIFLAPGGSATKRMSMTNAGAVTFSSSVTASAFFQSSDLRKKDIIKRDGDLVHYTWKDGEDKREKIGYIAQEVQQYMPNAVNEDKDGMLSVDYIQVLVAKISSIEKEIENLKNIK